MRTDTTLATVLPPPHLQELGTDTRRARRLRAALQFLGVAALLLGSSVPSAAVVIRGEFVGTFTESFLGPPPGYARIPEITVGDSFTGFFEYDTEDFEYTPPDQGDPGYWDFGATLSWSTDSMVSQMERLSAFVTEDTFWIGLTRDTDNEDDSINGAPPWYFNYSLRLEYSEPVFDPSSLPIASPPISKLVRGHLRLLGYTNYDSEEFFVSGEVTFAQFGPVPEPTTAALLGLGLAGLAVRRLRLS